MTTARAEHSAWPWAEHGPLLLLSMGIDSLAAWFLLGKPRAVYFDLNTRYSLAERLMLDKLRESKFGRGVTIYEDDSLRWLGTQERRDANVPMRNLLLATVAATRYRATDVILGAASEWARDKRLAFTLSASLSLTVAGAGHRVRVVRPFRYRTKAWLIAETTRQLGHTTWMYYAYSCYHGTTPPCGNCHACHRATIAFAAAGESAPWTQWAPPRWQSFAEVVRYARHGVSRRPALGEVWTTPLRLRELWQAWRNTR